MILKLTFMFHSFLRREILFDYEQYEYHGTSVSRHLFFFLFGSLDAKMSMTNQHVNFFYT